MNHTVDYYNKNARQYYDSTIDADLSSQIQKFAALLSPGARIIDVGCGSGRDTRVFLAAGYETEAFDASEEMCRIASEITGIQVRHICFEELQGQLEFDGIWACASLLHIKKELPV